MADSTIPSTQIPNSTIGSSNSSASNSKGRLDKDYTDFLKMLTTQLQNQDPTSPLDANQFTQQIVSFSQVEQAVNTNSNLEKLIGLNKNNDLSNAVSYMGLHISADGSSAPLTNGQAKFTYNLPSNATEVVVSISDATGKVVYSGPGEKSAGDHTVNWNGIGSDMTQQPDGNYNIIINAFDSTGNEITASTAISGLVTGVITEDGVPVLQLGDSITVPIGKVTGVDFPQNTNSSS